ncbi:MAG: 3-phosphoshikimate 1-carboxyvinyltransferase [Pseudomonadaceae bacterium]|nr:3-phosphoshikimate 1-carboxyvinyltransferase [Pseudomonadaceae bacterium]
MDQLTLDSTDALEGTVRLPGSKSISNRALLIAAMADGSTALHNLLASDDIERMLNALRALGVVIENRDDAWIVHGKGGVLSAEPMDLEFDLGLAGTALRPLIAALTLGSGRFLIDGNARMRERPVADLVDTLRQLGASIDYVGETGYPPVAVHGNGLGSDTATPLQASIRGDTSSQFLTSVLLAAPMMRAPVHIDIIGDLVSKPYVDVTLHVMRQFGAKIERNGWDSFDISPGAYSSPRSFLVEGDASSASYFLAAGAIRGTGVRVYGIGTDSVQGDVAFADTLVQMGAHVERSADSIIVTPGKLQGIDVDLNHIPDAAMTIATLALFAQGSTHIRNVANWRVKETDRLHAMATELRKVGATIDEGPDYLSITPPETLNHAAIDTYGDHRMAMCFSLLALADCGVTINDPNCVAKTFPDYFDVFERLSVRR